MDSPGFGLGVSVRLGLGGWGMRRETTRGGERARRDGSRRVIGPCNDYGIYDI